MKITGVRADESRNRALNSGEIQIVGKKKTTIKFLHDNDIEHSTTQKAGVILNFDNTGSRRAVEHCYRTTSTMINPILSWSEDDVWEFLHHYGCEANPLYQCGKARIGCIGCPMQGKKGQKREFRIYPNYYNNYIKAFEKMVLALNEKGIKVKKWNSGEDVMRWWLLERNEISGQTLFDGFDILDV